MSAFPSDDAQAQDIARGLARKHTTREQLAALRKIVKIVESFGGTPPAGITPRVHCYARALSMEIGRLLDATPCDAPPSNVIHFATERARRRA